MATALFGAGCFWGVEAAFRQVEGVQETAVGYDRLLDVFWHSHDPTQVNRQGPDVGSQYRSVIFVANEEQGTVAAASLERLRASGKHSRPIVTTIEPAPRFWPAEEYHQQYLEKRGLAQCHVPGQG